MQARRTRGYSTTSRNATGAKGVGLGQAQQVRLDTLQSNNEIEPPRSFPSLVLLQNGAKQAKSIHVADSLRTSSHD